jgi:Tol biopolymer transport system component
MEAHYALAWVYRSLGANDQSIEEFREVIRLAPRSPEAIEAAKAIQRIRLGPDYGAGQRLQIAFASAVEGNVDLYVMDSMGGNLLRLTTHPAVDDSPAWSPDGTRLAFVSERDGNREIYVMSVDGSQVVRVTDNPAVDDHPRWSPDGKRLAFESNRGGSFDVYQVALDGTPPVQVTHGPGNNWLGSWSPDGSQMAILSDRDGVKKVYLINADGSNPRRLDASPVAEERPIWGRDGYLYFTWHFEPNAQVCRASVDGKDLANVTRSPHNDVLCDVSADGKRILIQSDRHGDQELYLLDTEKGTTRRLTFHPGEDRDAVMR